MFVDGQSLYEPNVDPVAVRRQIGMVFQRPNPFPTMSIYENVLAGNRLNAEKLKVAQADEIARVSDETGFFNLKAAGEPGHLVEFNSTAKMFANPDNEATEAYISGRFG